MSITPDVITCDRCGEEFDATPKLLRRRIECRCGNVISPAINDGAADVEAIEGAPEVRHSPEGDFFIEGGDDAFTLYLLTPTHLLIRNAPASSQEKLFKLTAEKGSLDAAVKSKWHVKIELASITQIEARDGTDVIIIHHRAKGKVRRHKRSTKPGVHALLFQMLHARLAPAATPTVKPMAISELIWGPIGAAVLTVACGVFMFLVAMAPGAKTSSGKGRALQFIAEFLGPTGVAIVTGAVLITIGVWAWKRIASRPMKEILELPGRV